jgi:hypothetical protein
VYAFPVISDSQSPQSSYDPRTNCNICRCSLKWFHSKNVISQKWILTPRVKAESSENARLGGLCSYE